MGNSSPTITVSHLVGKEKWTNVFWFRAHSGFLIDFNVFLCLKVRLATRMTFHYCAWKVKIYKTVRWIKWEEKIKLVWEKLTRWQLQQSPWCSTYFSDSFLCGGSVPLPIFWGKPPQWKLSKSTAPFFPANIVDYILVWVQVLKAHQFLCKLSFISIRKRRVDGKYKTVGWKRNCFDQIFFGNCIL